MPSYHFRIKSDKRIDGTRTSAGKHEKYIDRKGQYAEYDEKQLEKLQYGNVITGANPIEHLPGRELVLYKSPFGCIKQDDTGIRVSRGASIETVAIALSVASKIYQGPLSVTGDRQFLEKSVSSVREIDLPVKFQDTELQQTLERQREEDLIEREKFIASGGTIREFIPGRILEGRIPEPDPKIRSLKDLTQQRFRLPTLSECNLVFAGRRPVVLLSRNEIKHMLQQRRERTARVRWDSGRARKRIIERTVNDIMVNVQTQSDTVFASSHVQYINRESAFKQRGGCIFTGNHLPRWAKNDPKIFFDAADRFERADGERYKEIEFSLPSELPLSAQKEIIDRFLDRHLKNFYYAYAIHDKIGSMSNGEHHPHVHIMFSTREMDAVEKTQERPPELFFRRSNPQNPSKGGCKKAAKWRGRNRTSYLLEMREDFANIQNDVLAKNGIALRVDHRSLKERRREALANGNYLLADLLNRIPEESVSPTALLEKDNPTVLQQKALRKLNHAREKNIILRRILQDAVSKYKTETSLDDFDAWLHKMEASLASVTDATEKANLKKQVDAVKEKHQNCLAMTNAVSWAEDIMETVKLESMTLSERECWQKLKQDGEEKRNWESFLENLVPRESLPEEDRAAQDAVRAEVGKTIRRLTLDLQKEAEELQPVFARMQQPANKKMIRQQIAMHLTNEDAYKRKLENHMKRLEQDMTKLDAAVRRELRQEHELRSYTMPEVTEILGKTIQEKKAELKRLESELRELRKKVISENRATEMAKNVFVKGEYKKLRDDIRHLKKIEKHLARFQREDAWKDIEKRQADLEARCSTPYAREKIAEITLGILRKNQPVRKMYESMRERVDLLKSEIAKESKIADRAEIAGVGYGKSEFRVAPPQGGGGHMSYPTPYHEARTIAKAVIGDVGAAAVVVYNKPNAPDEWNLMSEAEKDDLKNETASLEKY